jgi:hypothetical protein
LRLFADENGAKQFLIERIAARAFSDGRPLSDCERRLLECPDCEFDPDSDSCRANADGKSDDFEAFEKRVADLLRRAYDLDRSADVGAEEAYRGAVASLDCDDNLLWIARSVGLGPPIPKVLRVARHLALFALLVVPALLALLIAGIGVWGAIVQAASPAESVRGSMVAIAFAGFGWFLLGLWLKERRAGRRTSA